MTRQEYLEQVNLLLADNVNRNVTPAKVRLLLAYLSENWANLEEDDLGSGGSPIFSTNTQILTTNINLTETDATYQFLDPNGANRSVILGAMVNKKAFVIKNTGISFYLNVQAGVQSYEVFGKKSKNKNKTKKYKYCDTKKQ
jgi:hypothetical protein